MATSSDQETKKPAKKQRKKSRLPEVPTLPIGASVDPALMQEIDELCKDLPHSLPSLYSTLKRIASYSESDAAIHRANLAVEAHIPALLALPPEQQTTLFQYATAFLPPVLCVPICRFFAKSPYQYLRRRAAALIKAKRPEDVALPSQPDGEWDYRGWSKGIGDGGVYSHATGSRIQEANQLPILETVEDIYKFFDIQSQSLLGYLLLSSESYDESGPYIRFDIPKRDGEMRAICAPRGILKRIQRKILDDILSKIPAHDAAHGFVVGRSIVTNAAAHQGRKILLKFDLHNFFPTVHYYRVMGLFAHLGYTVDTGRFSTTPESRDIAPLLARLTTYIEPESEWTAGALPQGAPTSPAIANLVCRSLDARLTGLANKVGATYTRYADDLTFSFDQTPSSGIGRFRWWVDQICQQEGFALNQHKFRVIRDSQRQVVTGIVVNETLHIPRPQRRKFRAILHNCRTHGLASQARGNPGFSSYLQGFASYIHMVHPEEGTQLMKEVEEILKKEGIS